MDPSGHGEITQLLARLSAGDRAAEESLYLIARVELHRIACAQLRSERPGHTLQPTALVNEVYLRLCGQYQIDWQDRMHFFRIAAKLMRRVLVDYARQHGAQKRGARAVHVPVEEVGLASEDPFSLAVEIDELLQALAEESPRLVQVVEMRFFAQLSESEIAAALNVGERTVRRDWLRARAWLHSRLTGGDRG